MNDLKNSAESARVIEDAAVLLKLPTANAVSYLAVMPEEYREKVVCAIIDAYHDEQMGITRYYDSEIRRTELFLDIVERGYSDLRTHAPSGYECRTDDIEVHSENGSLSHADTVLLAQLAEELRQCAEAVKALLTAELTHETT